MIACILRSASAEMEACVSLSKDPPISIVSTLRMPTRPVRHSAAGSDADS